MNFIFEYFPKNTRVHIINANEFVISKLTVEGKDLLIFGNPFLVQSKQIQTHGNKHVISHELQNSKQIANGAPLLIRTIKSYCTSITKKIKLFLHY